MNAKVKSTLSLAFKAISLGMAAVSILVTLLNVATPALYAILMGIGLFCLAIAVIWDHPITN